MIYSGHAGSLDDIGATVTKVEGRLKPFKHKFDVIVATGLSGVLVASPLSIRMRKELTVLRKPNEYCHSMSDVVNAAALVARRYLILDDFISLGGTYNRIRTRLDEPNFRTRYVGCYLYCDDVLSWDGDDLISWSNRRNDDYRAKVDYRKLFETDIDMLTALDLRTNKTNKTKKTA